MLANKAKRMKDEEDEKEGRKKEEKRKEDAAKMALNMAFWVSMFRPECAGLSTNE